MRRELGRRRGARERDVDVRVREHERDRDAVERDVRRERAQMRSSDASSGRSFAAVSRPFAKTSFAMMPMPASCASRSAPASDGSSRLNVACTTSNTGSPSTRASRASSSVVADVAPTA
jgi:hypothetical protein